MFVEQYLIIFLNHTYSLTRLVYLYVLEFIDNVYLLLFPLVSQWYNKRRNYLISKNYVIANNEHVQLL